MRNYVDWKGFWSEGVGSSALQVDQPAVFSSGLSVTSGSVTFANNVNPEIIHVSLSGSDTSAASAQTNGIYFLYNRAAHGDIWYAVTANGAVRTETSTGVAVTAGQFTKFRIETLDTTQATFYINDVLVATITTNLPSGAGKVMGPGVIIAKTVGGTARTLDVDYVDIIANVANSGR